MSTLTTLAEIRRALELLSAAERTALCQWLQDPSELTYRSHNVEEPRAAYATLPQYMSCEEFLEFQARSPVPYEYVNGVIRAMSSPSIAHGLVTQNIFRAIDSRLRPGLCEAFCVGLDLRLRPGEDDLIYIPDVFVSCDRKEWHEKWIPNPKLVVEVLSPSTQHIDRREKAVNYRRVASLEEYVIAAQTRPELTIYRRTGSWLPEIVTGPGAVVELRSLGLSLPLTEVYKEVFSAQS